MSDHSNYYDILCIGFGPAALALAVTMADTGRISSGLTQNKLSQPSDLRVLFLEKQPQFLWHGGMLVDDAKMRISFVKDLASLRDPKSPFTFLNYLHAHGRLVSFLNLGTFYPFRSEFNDYLTWAAKQFNDCCVYGETVLSVEAGPLSDQGTIDYYKVLSVSSTGEVSQRTARNVVMAVGGRPYYPEWVEPVFTNYPNSKLIHTADYAFRINNLFTEAPKNLAVIGSGQSSAEVYCDLIKRFPESKVSLIFRDTALRPSDDSPFVNEVFDPSSTSKFLKKEFFERQKELKKNRATNYAVVNPDMIDSIYGMLYQQKLPGANSEHEVLPSHQIRSSSIDSAGKIVLDLTDTSIEEKKHFSRSFDAVFLGTGYSRNGHLDILKPVRKYCVERGSCCKIEGVDAVLPLDDYRVLMDERCKAGIWLQGCCEDTHGLSDTLLSVVSVRALETLESIENNLKSQKVYEYPTRPQPGQVLYRKYDEKLGETITLRMADSKTDVAILHEWMNNPRVSKFWGEQGPLAHQEKYLKTQIEATYSIPVIALFEDTPFAYFEIYWAAKSNLVPLVKLDKYDRGIHMLVGNESFRGSHRVAAWLPALTEFCFRDCQSTKKVVSEPRKDNDKMIGYLEKHGYSRKGAIQLPHKVSEYMEISRDSFENIGMIGK